MNHINTKSNKRINKRHYAQASKMKKCSIKIIGKVQGVAFRYYTKKKADELGLLGTTENQEDGSVVTFVSGREEDVDLFIAWCYQGSPASKVEEVIVKDLPVNGGREYSDFSILR